MKETWIIWIMRKRWFTCFTVLCSTTHSLMRMVSYVGHEVDRFESMVWNRIESWRRNHLWNTALVPDASHFAHDFICTTWCSLFFDCIFHGCRPLISLQKILHKWVYRNYSLHSALLDQVNSWFSAAVDNLLLLGVLRQCFVRQRINLLVQDPSTAANIHLTHARHTLNASGATFRRSRNEIPCMPLKGSLARFAVLVSELTNLNSWY